MKVLHVIPSLSAARGGPGIVLRQVMAGLAAQGITVHAATTDDDGPRARITVPTGVPCAEAGGTVFYFPRQVSFYSFSWPMTLWLARNIREYDVIHIHALFSYPSTVAAWLAHYCGVPYLIRPLGTLSQWGLAMRRPLMKRCSLALIERRILRNAAAVHATSEQERREVLEVCPYCRAVVIPNPVSIPTGTPARSDRLKPQVILFLSRIDPKKGLELLLAAFDQIAASHTGANRGDLLLVIAGDGDRAYVDSIHRMAKSLSARERITFTGGVDAERKQELFADADLFVLPSHSENFGVSVVEAMAHGIPVLISPNVGIHNEVTAASAGRTAICAVEPLAQAMCEMMESDPDSLKQMGRNGRLLAAERYAPDIVARLLVAEYENIIGEATGRARQEQIIV
jgi:glycosyltransferase involved in cell wall biosynthesis